MSFRRPPSSPLLPALLFSLAIHAVGGVLLGKWARSPGDAPRPIEVTLEVRPPVVVEPPPAPPQIERSPSKRKTEKAVAPAPLQRTPPPPPSVIAVDRAESPATPAVVTPPVESPPVPAPVAKRPADPIPAPRVDTIEPPHFNAAYLNNPRPAYPPIARKLGVEGVVVLRVQVSAAGTPEQVAIAKTSGSSVLDEAALKAVQGWTFVPARRGDTPIPHPVDVPIRFQLKN